jgi:hypothetical protein
LIQINMDKPSQFIVPPFSLAVKPVPGLARNRNLRLCILPLDRDL